MVLKFKKKFFNDSCKCIKWLAKKKKNHIHACVTLTLNDNRKTEKKLRRYNGDNGKDVDVQLKA